MSILSDNARDAALQYIINNATEIHICSAEPLNFGEVAGVSLGNFTPVIGAPTNGATEGRRITVTSGGSVATATGNASHFAIVNAAGSELVAADLIDAPFAVVAGSAFLLAAFDITFPDQP